MKGTHFLYGIATFALLAILAALKVKTMRHFLQYAFLILFAICSLLGCQDTSTDILLEEEPSIVAAQDETQPPESIATKPTPEVTFARLRSVFPETMLDADFTALRKVTRSRLYRDFLGREYPTQPPVETPEAYYQRVPDAAKYRRFLKPWVHKPLETDIEMVHPLVLYARKMEVILFKLHHEPNLGVWGNLAQLGDPKGLDIGFGKDRLEQWFILHDIDWHLESPLFLDALLLFAKESLREDAIWLHELFDAHGTDDGLLWCALRNPALTGEILTHFSDTELFLTWVHEKSSENKK